MNLTDVKWEIAFYLVILSSSSSSFPRLSFPLSFLFGKTSTTKN